MLASLRTLRARQLSLLVFLLIIITSAQAATLSGVVVDERKAPLTGTTISIPALKLGTIADQDGSFQLSRVSPGIYTVQFSLIGYRSETRVIELSDRDVELQMTLLESPLEFSPITVSASPQPTDVLHSPQPVSVISGRPLDSNRGQTLGETIKDSPGVSVYSTGSALGKPVIRGLSSQRVLVVTDGVRQEGQQWGDEHAPEIDALDIERVEILRGPNSVLYGSDALGGVIHIIKPEPPTADISPRLRGKLLLNGMSNNGQGAGALGLSGAVKQFGYRGNISVRDAGDTDTPEGTLTNSGEEELNGAAAVGIQGAWGALLGDYGHFGSRLEIHEDPAEEPDFTGFQKVRHDYAHVHALLPSAHWRIEVDGGLQYNNRREFEEKDAVDPVLHLKLTTATLDVKAHHSPVGKMNGTIGAALMSQQNESDAEEKLIPDFTSDNVAGFIYEELALGRVNLTGGVRADARTLNVHVSEELGVAAQTRDFSTASGTLGAVWRAEEPWAVAVNIGRGWRAPTAFELFVDGVHEGTVRYEIGDATLDPEQSLNLDLSVRYIGPRVQAEIALYQNRIDNYIFLQPTGEVDDESGFTTFQHQQADATLQGGEFSVEGQATAWLILKAGADLVRGNNDKTDHPLPLMPADRLRIGTKFIQPRMGGVLNPYLALSTTFTADAERLESAELRTPGYSLVNAGVGGEFNVGEERATVDLVVDNLLDKSYRDHLSRYKEYALNPGQNVMLKIGVPFTLIRN